VEQRFPRRRAGGECNNGRKPIDDIHESNREHPGPAGHA
jgi:hypothetical protein